MAILAPQRVAHVQPAMGCGLPTGLQYHLVEVAVLPDEVCIPAHGFLVGDVDVGCLAHLVLAVEGASHRHVQEVAAVPAGDDDAAESLAQGLEHHLAQHHHAQDEDDVGRCVVDAVPDGGARLEKLAEGEVWGEEHLMHPRLFVGCVFHVYYAFCAALRRRFVSFVLQCKDTKFLGLCQGFSGYMLGYYSWEGKMN